VRGGKASQVTSAPVVAPPPTPVAPDPRLTVMLEEWREIRTTSRHTGNVRLAQLALSFACAAFLLVMYLQAPVRPPGWLVPLIGAGTALGFLALELGVAADARVLGRRGQQIEFAVQTLLPGLGPVQSLATITGLNASAGVRNGTAVRAVHALLLLGWLAALVRALI
jgi:hypothetical protein